MKKRKEVGNWDRKEEKGPYWKGKEKNRETKWKKKDG